MFSLKFSPNRAANYNITSIHKAAVASFRIGMRLQPLYDVFEWGLEG